MPEAPRSYGRGMEDSPSEGGDAADTLTAALWPPELRDNAFLVFHATHFVVL